MNTKKLVVASFFCLAVLATALAEPLLDGAVTPDEYQNSTVLDDGRVRVSWTLGDSQAWFALSVQAEGWLALGFGAENMMQGADMVIGWVADDGTASVLDCFSTGPYGPHPPDTELGGKDDLLAFAASENEGWTIIEFSRPLAASEAFDKPVASGESFLWAYGPTDDFDEYHPAAGYGTLAAGESGESGASADGPAAGAPVASGSARPRPLAGILVYVLPHALPLILSFTLMTAAMLVARYGKKNKKWLSIHKPLGAGGALLGLVGLGLGIRMVALSGGPHLRVPHAWLGAVTLILAVSAPILGQAMFKVKKNKAGVRKLHRWVGRAAIILMALTIISGLFQSGILG